MEQEIVSLVFQQGKTLIHLPGTIRLHSIMLHVLDEQQRNLATGVTIRNGVITAAAGLGLKGTTDTARSIHQVAAARLGRKIAEAYLDSRRGGNNSSQPFWTWRTQENRRGKVASSINSIPQSFISLDDLHSKANAKLSGLTENEQMQSKMAIEEYKHTLTTLRTYVRKQLLAAVSTTPRITAPPPIHVVASAAIREPPSNGMTPLNFVSSPAGSSSTIHESIPCNGQIISSVLAEEEVGSSQGVSSSCDMSPIQGVMYVWSFGGDTGVHVKIGMASVADPTALLYRFANINGYKWDQENLLIFPFSNIPFEYSIKHLEILFADLACCQSYAKWNHGVWCGDPTAIEEEDKVRGIFRTALRDCKKNGTSQQRRGPRGYNKQMVLAARQLQLPEVTSTGQWQRTPRQLYNHRAELYLK